MPTPFRTARFAQLTTMTSADPARLPRAQGCLLGQLAGDSLGGLVEFQSAEQIRRRYPDGLRDLADGGTWRNCAGQLTDDSELALMLARSIVQAGGYDEELVLSAYADWAQDPQTFDIGMATARALRSFRPEMTHEERLAAIASRANGSSEANGSLMRCSPLGIFCAGDPARGAALARQDSRLTHPNEVCQESCAAFVAAIAVAMDGGDPYAVALSTARNAKVVEALEGARHGPPADYETSMGHVVIALRNAFWQLLHAPSLEEGIVSTVMAGGDTDTNAAIAGALLGAVHGRDAVPERWIEALRACRAEPGRTSHPRAEEFWPTDALELAGALLR